MEKTLTLDELIAQMEELAREFSSLADDLQRGFEILGEFVELNSQWAFLKKISQ